MGAQTKPAKENRKVNRLWVGHRRRHHPMMTSTISPLMTSILTIDVSEQKGATEEAARRGIVRAYSADDKSGANITSIIVIGKNFDVKVPRKDK